MALIEIPAFPFPRVRSILDAVQLINHPDAARFLGALEEAREALNAEIRNHNALANLDANLALAADAKRLAQLELLAAEKERESIRSIAAQEAQDVFDNATREVRAFKAGHEDWLEKTLSETRQREQDASAAYRESSELREKLIGERKAVITLKNELQTKVTRLNDALANL